MLGEAPQCPSRRQIANLTDRIARLEAYEHWRSPTKIDFEAILGAEAFADYWRELDRVVTELETSQVMATKLRDRIAAASNVWTIRPTL
jgi:hypothetical protein